MDHPDWQSITLTVTAEAGAQPLAGSVQFLLHPSFANDRPVVAVQNGEATLTVMSWGAFTAGAVADGGATKLELDLSQLAGAPEPWRSR